MGPSDQLVAKTIVDARPWTLEEPRRIVAPANPQYVSVHEGRELHGRKPKQSPPRVSRLRCFDAVANDASRVDLHRVEFSGWVAVTKQDPECAAVRQWFHLELFQVAYKQSPSAPKVPNYMWR